MCGIAGLLDGKNRIEPSAVKKMTDSIAHRGPDAEGFLFANQDGTTLSQSLSAPGTSVVFALGHRRLSIIDLEGGAQPLSNEDGSVWVTYNGEIYNHLELREQLIKNGHIFRTDHSDTEVIVHAYEQWGIEGFDRFNGIFAFGILDLQKKKLVLARDHFGVKPLYYHDDNGRFYFSSEVKAIFAGGARQKEVDPAALSDYLSFRYVPSPRTLFKGIFKLEAGGFVEWDLTSRSISRSGNFTSSATAIDHKKSFSDWVHEYQYHFEQAIQRQLISDVEVGALLSGGVDSSAVCSIATRSLGKPIRTYTVGFKDFGKGNEFEEAAVFAKDLGSLHREVVIDDTDFVDVLGKVAWSLDEPSATSSAIPLYYLTQEIKKDVKVVLTGQGADEPLAGYPRYYGERLYQCGFRYLDFIKPVVETLPRQEKVKRAFRSFCQNDPFTRFMSVYYLFTPAEQKALLKQEVVYQDNPLLSRLFHQYRPDDVLGKMLYIDTRAWLPDDLLLYGDKATMVNSIEARVPILDKELVAFIETIPSKYKLSVFLKAKLVHKKACEKWLPQYVIRRPKKGFFTPIDKWFRNELGGYIADELVRGKLTSRLFNPGVVKKMIEDHQSGQENYQRQLFALLMLEKWAEAFDVRG
jgi:asparagine synthase (glutamine-hydrolysing)